jgi:LysM repeat protein
MFERAGSSRAGVAALALAAMLTAGCTSSDNEAIGTIATTAAPSPTSPEPVVTPAPTEQAPAKTYIVMSGDSLSAIAAAAKISLGELVAANPWTDGAAHVIHPGDVVTLPLGATQPVPRSTSTTTSDSPGSNSPTSVAGDEMGGYRLVAPEALLLLSDEGISHSVDDPLADGVYYAGTYELTADGSGVRFDLAQFYSTDACIAATDTVPGETVDESGCYGGSVDTSSTAVVTMRLDNDVPVILVSADYKYLEVTANEFARLLKGEPPAPDAPAWFVYQPYWDAMVQIADGKVVRANQRPSS